VHILRHKHAVILAAIFYIVAGINHFIMPEFYYPLIPDYFENKSLINWLAGAAEVIIGVGYLFSVTKKWSAIATILMLILFIPSHTHFISIGSCSSESLCVHPSIAWIRLLLIHPLLLFWAFAIATRKD
jgi:uncharacterized membrane protein